MPTRSRGRTPGVVTWRSNSLKPLALAHIARHYASTSSSRSIQGVRVYAAGSRLVSGFAVYWRMVAPDYHGRYGLVTEPSLAEATSLQYFAMTPVL
jgi:hypothetical protein